MEKAITELRQGITIKYGTDWVIGLSAIWFHQSYPQGHGPRHARVG